MDAKQNPTLQEALEQANAANKIVEHEKMKYKLVVESMNIALWEVEATTQNMESTENLGIWTWSQEFRHILGFSDENDFPNTLEAFLERLHPEDTEKSIAAFREHFNDRSGKTPYNIEYRLRHKNGEYLYLDGFGTTLRDSEGFPIRTSGAIRDITVLKQATSELILQKNTLQTIINSIPDIVFCKDPDSRYSLLNTACIKFLGTNMENVLGKDDTELGFPAAVAEKMVWADKKILAGEQRVVYDDWIPSFGGKMHYLETTKAPIVQDGEVIGIVGISRDLTDLKKTAEALKIHGAMLSALNKTAIMFLSQNEETFVKMMSSGMGQIVSLFDFDRFSLFRNFTNPDSDQNLFTSQIYRWEKTSGGTTPVNRRYVNVTYDQLIPNWKNVLKDGNVVQGPRNSMPKQEEATLQAAGTLSVLIVPVFIDDAFWGFAYFEDLRNERYFDDDCVEIMRSAAFLCANAVMRNEMENERGKLMTGIYYRDELLNAVNQAAALLLNSEIGTFEKNLSQSMGIMAQAVKADRIYIWKNKMHDGQLCHTQLFEWSQDAELQLGNEQTKNLPYSVFSQGWGEHLSSGNFVNGPVRELQPEAQTFLSAQNILSVLIAPIFIKERFWGIIGFDDCHNERVFTEEEMSILQSGGLLFANALLRNEMVRNISETSARLEIALEQAKAASKAKGDFLSAMSHEMRTPMNAIIGMTTIGKKANDIQGKNHALSKIGDASSHLLGVINDVLDMAKIEANKLELAPVEFNFERMLQRVTTVANFRVDEKQQKFSVNIDSNIPNFLVGDDQRLAQVITNLLSNAVKFTPEGGEIKLGASLLGEMDGECELCIYVADNGIGIASQQHEKLFGMFEQAETGTSRQYGGTGLGLGIAKNIVELMGGRIWVESELGKGAKFVFTVKTQRGTKNPRSLLSPGVNWDNVRILAVDDIVEVHHQFQDIFDNLEIKCDVASSGHEAWSLIEERGEYDIYFIDWRMPGMDGIELTRKIKSRVDGRQSVVIMITAMDWDQIREEAGRAGVDKHLLKPLFPSMVIDCVNECLGSARTHGDTEHTDGMFAEKKLLLAEDIEINREILIALLEDTGLLIDCAENGSEALEKIEADPDKYDIVFMDVQMPKMDGLEATRRIRALPAARKRIPIIAMTANVFKDDIEECITAGMDDHLGKPLDIDRVLEVLRKYLIH